MDDQACFTSTGPVKDMAWQQQHRPDAVICKEVLQQCAAQHDINGGTEV